MVKEFTDGFADENLTEGKMGEDLMECVLWKAIDWGRIHPGYGGGAVTQRLLFGETETTPRVSVENSEICGDEMVVRVFIHTGHIF